MPQQKVQATSLIVKTLFTYDAATPESSHVVTMNLQYDAIVGRGVDLRHAVFSAQAQEQGVTAMLSRLHRLRNEQDGFGLILVIGVTAFVTVLIVTASVVAVHGLEQSQNRAKFEQSLASAENGVDSTLARLQKAFDDYNADYPIPVSAPSPSRRRVLGGRGQPTRRRSPPRPPRTPGRGRNWPRCPARAGRPGRQRRGRYYLVLKPATPLVNGAYPKYGKMYALGMSPSQARRRRRHPDGEGGVRLHAVPAHPRRAHRRRPEHLLEHHGAAAYGVDPALASVHPTAASPPSWATRPSADPVTSTGNSAGGEQQQVRVERPEWRRDVQAAAEHPEGQRASRCTSSPPASPAVTTNWYDLCADGTARP